MRFLFVGKYSIFAVTSLESVVLQLQDSCREARSETQELRQQNASLRHEYREREKFWRALWQSRKTGENDELPPLPQPILNGHMGSSQLHPYGAESMAYRSHDDPTMCSGQYNAGPSHSYSHSPSMPYSGDVSGENSPHPLTQRGAKYGAYSYNVHGSHRDHSWPQNIGQNATSSGEPGPPPSAHSSNSPSFSESPTLTSPDLSGPFAARFGEDQKVPVNNLDSAPYVFPGSRSISPSSTTPSSSSASLTSPFQFTFPDGTVPQDRADFDYRRNSNHRSDVGLHGGSEVSLSGPGSDAVRYRLGTRRADSGADRPILPILPPLSMSDHGSQQDRASSDGDSNSFAHPRLRPRRDSVISPPSRSSSPSAVPQLSGTLAVIKAQAFGALRRTRARTKKPSDGANKLAMDVLEARGIEMGVSSGSKRQRTEESDEGERQQT